MKAKELLVEVTYRVGIGNIEIPNKVYDQLMEANENGKAIDGNSFEYAEASEWLSDNIKERDCVDWECEIEDIS